MRIEQRQLLMAMHGIRGIVDIERDRLGRSPVAGRLLIRHATTPGF